MAGLDAELWVVASTLESPPGNGIAHAPTSTQIPTPISIPNSTPPSTPTHYCRREQELCSHNPSIRHPLLSCNPKVGSSTYGPVTPWHWIVSQGMAIQHSLWPLSDYCLTTCFEAVSLMSRQIPPGHHHFFPHLGPSSTTTSTITVFFSSANSQLYAIFFSRRGKLLSAAYAHLPWAGRQISSGLQVSHSILPLGTLNKGMLDSRRSQNR